MNFCRSGFLGASEVKKNEKNGKYQLLLPSGEVKNIRQWNLNNKCWNYLGHEFILFDICMWRHWQWWDGMGNQIFRMCLFKWDFKVHLKKAINIKKKQFSQRNDALKTAVSDIIGENKIPLCCNNNSLLDVNKNECEVIWIYQIWKHKLSIVIIRMRTWNLCTQVIQIVLGHGSVITGACKILQRILNNPFFQEEDEKGNSSHPRHY